MRVRHLIRQSKEMVSDTGWSAVDLPPKHSAIYARTKPMRAGWQWRSVRARSSDREFVLLSECNARRGNFKAALIVVTESGPSAVCRFEYHSDHPGLHAHAHCERGGVELGPTGFGGLERVPAGDGRHRRTSAWTPTSFWCAAEAFFRLRHGQGSLDLDAS